MNEEIQLNVKKGENAVGIFTLPIGLYCDVDCLKTYDAIVAGKQIKIDFPQYVEPEEKSIEMGSIIAPPAAKTFEGEKRNLHGEILII